MASRTAQITSIEAVGAVKAALAQFSVEVLAALDSLQMESRRPLDWIEHDQSQYWPREIRTRSDQLSEARLALQKCELTIDGTHSRYCYDERKALERARLRMRMAEEKLQAVRRWRTTIRKEVEEFQVQVEKLRHFLTTDFLQAAVALERMASALDRYVEQQTPAATASPATQATDNSPEPAA